MNTETENNTMRCRACLTPIPCQARKCAHCGSYQRFFSRQKFVDAGDFSFGAISLVMSFIATLIAIYPQISDRKQADIQFDVVHSSEGKISLIIRNEGTVPAAITDGYVSTLIDGGPMFSSRINIKPTPTLVRSGDYDVITLESFAGVPFVAASSEPNSSARYKCRIAIKYSQLGKPEEYETSEFTCVPQNDVKGLLEELDTPNKSKTKSTRK